MKTICLFLVFGTCGLMAQKPASPDKLCNDDLRFMTAVVPTFYLGGVLKGNLEQLCETTAESILGKGHKIPFQISYEKDVLATGIHTEFHNIPMPELLHYIAELSGCKWKYCHWPGAPVLTFEPIKGIDDTRLFHRVQTFKLTPDGVRHLGLRDDMSEGEVRKLLQGYGVEFPEEANAYWNGKTHMLAIRNLAEEDAVVSGIVRVANKGFEFVRSPAKEEVHKK